MLNATIHLNERSEFESCNHSNFISIRIGGKNRDEYLTIIIDDGSLSDSIAKLGVALDQLKKREANLKGKAAK